MVIVEVSFNHQQYIIQTHLGSLTEDPEGQVGLWVFIQDILIRLIDMEKDSMVLPCCVGNTIPWTGVLGYVSVER